MWVLLCVSPIKHPSVDEEGTHDGGLYSTATHSQHLQSHRLCKAHCCKLASTVICQIHKHIPVRPDNCLHSGEVSVYYNISIYGSVYCHIRVYLPVRWHRSVRLSLLCWPHGHGLQQSSLEEKPCMSEESSKTIVMQDEFSVLVATINSAYIYMYVLYIKE